MEDKAWVEELTECRCDAGEAPSLTPDSTETQVMLGGNGGQL